VHGLVNGSNLPFLKKRTKEKFFPVSKNHPKAPILLVKIKAPALVFCALETTREDLLILWL